MKKLAVASMLVLAAVPAQSQVRRRVSQAPEPAVWVTGSIGLFNGNDVSDGATSSVWDFGRASVPQYRLAVEKSFSRTASIGATGTIMHAPFTYLGPDAPASCTRCGAHLDVISVGASFHVGGGLGLHQVLEGSAGAIQYRNLKRDDGKTPLSPIDGNIDPYFTFGYGFGYTLNPTTQISIVQDFGLAIHERKGLTSEDSNTLTQRTIRLNLRYGLGNRIRRR